MTHIQIQTERSERIQFLCFLLVGIFTVVPFFIALVFVSTTDTATITTTDTVTVTVTVVATTTTTDRVNTMLVALVLIRRRHINGSVSLLLWLLRYFFLKKKIVLYFLSFSNMVKIGGFFVVVGCRWSSNTVVVPYGIYEIT